MDFVRIMLFWTNAVNKHWDSYYQTKINFHWPLHVLERQDVQYWQKMILTKYWRQHAKPMPLWHSVPKHLLPHKKIYILRQILFNENFSNQRDWTLTAIVNRADGKSFTPSFRTKMIPPPLWNACDFVVKFNFTKARIPGKNNFAAGLL